MSSWGTLRDWLRRDERGVLSERGDRGVVGVSISTDMRAQSFIALIATLRRGDLGRSGLREGRFFIA